MESKKSNQESTSRKDRKLPFHPCVSRKCMETLISNFPKAEFTSDVYKKVNQAVLSLGFTPDNTLLASSVCPDEINHHPESINRKL